MPFTPTPPDHYCQLCGKALWPSWPYAVCKPCSKKPCAHGNPLGSCDACDVEGDRAYDASRGN